MAAPRWNRTKALSDPCPRCGAASGETCRGLDHNYLHAPRLIRGASLTYDFGTTGGSSGTETSEARAERLANEKPYREEAIIRLLDTEEGRRLTTKQIAFRLFPLAYESHSLASSAVSNMADDDRVLYLAEQDDGAHLVCLPENRDGDDLARRKGKGTVPPPPDPTLTPTVVDLTWISDLVGALDHHLAHEGEPVELRTSAGGWRDVIDYIPEEYR